jgi:hypothetical protein
MSVSLGVALNVIFDACMVGGLAWAMSRPHKLRPHRPASERLRLIELRAEHARVEHQRRVA